MPLSSDHQDLYRSIGQLIRAARTEEQVSQLELARRCNLSRASISNIEKGRQHPPVHTLFDIAAAIGVAPVDLLPKVSERGFDADALRQEGLSEQDLRTLFTKELGHGPSEAEGS